MRVLLSKYSVFHVLVAVAGTPTAAPQSHNVPRVWDDSEIASLEVPVADSVGSPKHVSADYYYRIPVRPIYRQYPVYAPGHQPSGYLDWLKKQKPEIVW